MYGRYFGSSLTGGSQAESGFATHAFLEKKELMEYHSIRYDKVGEDLRGLELNRAALNLRPPVPRTDPFPRGSTTAPHDARWFDDIALERNGAPSRVDGANRNRSLASWYDEHRRSSQPPQKPV